MPSTRPLDGSVCALCPHALTGGVDHVLQHAPQLLGLARLGLRQIDLGIVECLFEHVQAVPDRFELFARDHQLVLAQPEVERAAAGFVIALAARTFAVETRSARARHFPERAAAPSAGVFRHSDESYGPLPPIPRMRGTRVL